MKARFWATVLFVTSCGGSQAALDLGGGGQPPANGDAGALSPSETLARDGWAQLMLEGEDVAGTRADDLWIAQKNALSHWDGIKIHPASLPGTIGNFNIAHHIASAGPGAVWIANEGGLIE